MTERPPRLSQRQRDFLFRPINPGRVLKAQNHSHLPAFDVEAHLTRVFGFEGWDREIVDLWLVHETGEEKGGRTGWTVTYGCRLRVTLRDPSGKVIKVMDGCATGSANNLPSRGDAHDFAMKNADSYALKRCAKALGDQFGLSLYNKGSVAQLISDSAAYGPDDAPAATDENLPMPLSMGNDERQEDSQPANPIPVEGEGEPHTVEVLAQGSPPVADRINVDTGEIVTADVVDAEVMENRADPTPEHLPRSEPPSQPTPIASSPQELKIQLQQLLNDQPDGEKSRLRARLLTLFGPQPNRTLEQLQESVDMAAGWPNGANPTDPTF